MPLVKSRYFFPSVPNTQAPRPLSATTSCETGESSALQNRAPAEAHPRTRTKSPSH